MNETAIEKKADLSMGALGFEIATLEQAWRYAKIIVASGLAPKGETPESALIKIEYGQQLGLSNMSAIQNIANINGRPSIFGDAAIGLVRKSGLVDLFDETIIGEGDKAVAKCRTKRRGEESIHERTFSVEDAKRANLWGKVGPWTQYPKRMLQLRARGWAIRDVYPDVIQGLSLAEEARDIPAADYIDVTPEKPVEEKPKSKADALSAKLGLKKGSEINQPPISTDEEKGAPATDTPPPEPKQEDDPTDQSGEEAEFDEEEARRMELCDLIDEREKYKLVTFKKYVKAHCDDPIKWRIELTVEQLGELAELIDVSK